MSNLVADTSDPSFWRGKYVTFQMQAPDPKKKTVVWSVIGSDGSLIAEVRWFARWRKYCFFPFEGAVFEETCLGDIAEFIIERTKDHKRGI